jgi:hypothetical protein
LPYYGALIDRFLAQTQALVFNRIGLVSSHHSIILLITYSYSSVIREMRFLSGEDFEKDEFSNHDNVPG